MDPQQQPTPPQQPYGGPQPQSQKPQQPQSQMPAPHYPAPPEQQWDQPAQAPQQPGEVSDKSYVLAFVFSFLLGGIGVDRFYLGHIGTGIAKLLTLGGLGIWALVDFLLIAFGKLKDNQGRELQGYREHGKTVKIVSVALILVSFVISGLLVLSTLLSVGSIQKNSRDVSRKTDLNVVAADLATQQAENNGALPSKQAFESGAYTLSPGTTLGTLSLSDIEYEPAPEGCGETTPCRSYTLTTKLEDGTDYTVSQ